ncbi:MAG: Rrf2 family transcriptional regulator [Myxococcales bacterium]|nr:Rrf2 family transcriptional regulator [Myxococcales bacterium]
MRKSGAAKKRRNTAVGGDRIAPLSQTAEYALRAMTHLALRADQPALTATELASETHVPVHYLSKVLRRLVAAGLLASQKGHGGGFSLARPASEIQFADVLGAIGEAPVGGRCAFGWGSCDAKNPCPLHPAWTALNDALQGWATRTSLGDIVTQPNLRKRRN